MTGTYRWRMLSLCNMSMLNFAQRRHKIMKRGYFGALDRMLAFQCRWHCLFLFLFLFLFLLYCCRNI